MIVKSFWKDFWAVLRPYWRSDEKWLAIGLLFLIIIGEIGQVALAIKLNNWQKGFYDALQAFNKSMLSHYMLEFAGMVAVFVIVIGYLSYFSGLLINRWRRWLTNVYQKRWMLDKNYYLLAIYNKNIDNPDQRISEDLNEFPSLTLALFSGALSSILTLSSFSIVLWHLSGSFRLPVIDRVIPGYMFWGALILAGFGTMIAFRIGIRLPDLSYQQERFNANFRFRLIRIREAAEQIAFYRGERNENSRLTQSFEYIFNNFLDIIKVRKYLTFFNTAYLNFSNLAGILLALPRFLAERLPIGILMQAKSAFERVHEALSFIVFSYPTIANWRAVIFRLAEFNNYMDEIKEREALNKVVIQEHTANKIHIAELVLHLPSNDILFKNINLTIYEGERILIQGPSGIGKSTLLRAIAGLWPYGEGYITTPEKNKMMFLPQKPYLPLGTIKDILAYPQEQNQFTLDALEQALKLANLTHLISMLDMVQRWEMILSWGEQQRLAFARLFLQKPEWILLDESTSALDEENESMLYQNLIIQIPNAAIISIGHRNSLKALHNRLIAITDFHV